MILIGLSVAAPVGPIGVLTIHRTLARGRFVGLATGLGVATADAFYAALAAFSLTMLSSLLISISDAVRLVGGIFLLYLGIRTLRSLPAAHAARISEVNGRRFYAGAYFSALGLTLTNPMTILMFAGIFAGAGLATRASDCPAAPFLTVGGIFSGSLLWWLILTTGVSLLRGRFTPPIMRWVNRASGAIIILFAISALMGLLALD